MAFVQQALGRALVLILQVYAFLGIAYLYGIKLPPMGYLWVLPALLVSGLMLGAVGLFLASTIRQLENFAGVMNFVIFPVFFLSTALYPLWRMAESSTLLRDICVWNPFSHAVELIRFALYMQLNLEALGWVVQTFAVFLALALWGFDPARGIITRKIPS